VDEELTVRRWRRYGADRLFVTQGTGARVGSVDLQSGEVVVEDPELEDGLRRAAQAYLRSDVTELVLPVPAPADGLSLQDEAALRGWLGAPDEGPDELAALRRERGSSVRERLDRLAAEGWQVVHGVPLGRQGDQVEHLMIGPAGIFTVRERHHPGQHVVVEGRSMTVDGVPVPYLRDARLEADRVRDRLLAAACAGVTARAVLVVQGELELRGPTSSEDALVVQRHDLPQVFRLLATRLEADRVQAVAQVARRRRTWGV
jgi:hypothetical protein